MRISETPSGRAVERCMKQGILPVSVPDRSRDPHDGGTSDRAGHRCGRSKRDGLRKADRIRCSEIKTRSLAMRASRSSAMCKKRPTADEPSGRPGCQRGDPVWRLHRHLRPAGIGKEENYSYDIYEVEFIPEALFGVSYRKSLTTLFPRFLNVMANAHGADIRRYLEDAFGYTGDLVTSTDRLIDLFSELGADMYFDGEVKEEQVRSLPVESQLSMDQRIRMIRACMCNQREYALRS